MGAAIFLVMYMTSILLPFAVQIQEFYIFYTPANKVWGFIGITLSVRPSVCLSVRLSVCPLRVRATTPYPHAQYR